MPIHVCSYWSIKIEDWLPESDGGTLLLSSPDDSAMLRIDAVGAWAPEWDDLVAEAGRRAPRNADIVAVNCGDFSGLTYEGRNPEGEYYREWLLTLGESFLLVSYSTEQSDHARDRRVVDKMLATLTDGRP